MARKPTGNPTGRPPREFDPTILEGLCAIQCTQEEIERTFKTDIRTLNGWCERSYGESFSEIYKRFSAEGKASLRRNQFNQSRKNASMAIWLGKQWLGQREAPTEEKGFDSKLAHLLDRLLSVENSAEFNSLLKPKQEEEEENELHE